jgi:hypothetical protein
MLTLKKFDSELNGPFLSVSFDDVILMKIIGQGRLTFDKSFIEEQLRKRESVCLIRGPITSCTPSRNK